MTNLTQRLLCAAKQAYEIYPDGVRNYGDGAEPFAVSDSACITYVTPPVGFLADKLQVDAAFAAVIPEGVLISVRGTLQPGKFPKDTLAFLRDWSRNINAVLRSTQGESIVFPGKVHPQFYRSFRNLWDGPSGLGAACMELIEQHPDKRRVLLTGHSKGGAICPLIAWRLHEIFATRPELANHRITVRAFAPARIGDGVFAEAYNAAIPDHIRYEYEDDLVPHLPIRTASLAGLGVDPKIAQLITTLNPGYGEVGRLRYIGADGAYADLDEAARIAAIGQRLSLKGLIGGGARHIVDRHEIGIGTGYARALYDAPEDLD